MKKILILENSKKLNQVLTTHQKTEKVIRLSTFSVVWLSNSLNM